MLEWRAAVDQPYAARNSRGYGSRIALALLACPGRRDV